MIDAQRRQFAARDADRARHVAPLACDTRPDSDSPELFKRIRYGRTR